MHGEPTKIEWGLFSNILFHRCGNFCLKAFPYWGQMWNGADGHLSSFFPTLGWFTFLGREGGWLFLALTSFPQGKRLWFRAGWNWGGTSGAEVAIQAGQSSSPCKIDWAGQLQARQGQNHMLTLLLTYHLPVSLVPGGPSSPNRLQKWWSFCFWLGGLHYHNEANKCTLHLTTSYFWLWVCL